MQVRIPKFVESQVGSETKSTHRIKIIYGNDFILENVIHSNDLLEKIRLSYINYQIPGFMLFNLLY